MYYGYQPYPVYQPMPQSQGIAGVRFVNGIDEAKAVAIPYGTKALFMDMNEDAFYIKETDATGASTVDMYTFVKVEPEHEEYVTRAEFEELKRRYESVVQQSQDKQQYSAQQQSTITVDATHPDDQPRAGQAAGAATYSGAWNNAGGVGTDGY